MLPHNAFNDNVEEQLKISNMGICRSDVCSKFSKDGCPKSAHLTKRATIQKRSKEINVCTHLDPKWDTRNLSNSIKFNPHHPPNQIDCYCEHFMFSSHKLRLFLFCHLVSLQELYVSSTSPDKSSPDTRPHDFGNIQASTPTSVREEGSFSRTQSKLPSTWIRPIL